jgi:hypothetical protein
VTGLRYFLLLFFCAPAIHAQVNNVFTLKPSFGINGCQIHGDNYSGYDKFGVFGGTSINARLNKKTSVELGFYFSQKGSRHNPNPKNNDYTFYRVHLNYLDMPLSLYYQANDRFFITLGPSVAYLISYREENERGDWTGDYPFNKFEAGLNIGLGARLNDKWHFELRCSNSITPLRNYGIAATNVYYPNPVARFFNKGLYSNLLSLFFTYQLSLKRNGQ